MFKLAVTALGSGLEPDAKKQLQHVTAESRLLASRAEQDEVRDRANAFHPAAVRLARTNTDDMTREEIRRVIDMYNDLTRLIGQLIRERY
jgi:uncharacterized coiled-coil DUF342 family protein